MGAGCPVTDLDADQVAAVFEELWAGRAPATWNTRRVAVQAFASWCGERWPLAGDPLSGVAPRRQPADNTRAVPYADLEELWRRRGVPLREKLLWRMLYETAARASEVLAFGCGGPGPGPAAGPDPFQGWQHGHGGVGGAHRSPVGPLFG